MSYIGGSVRHEYSCTDQLAVVGDKERRLEAAADAEQSHEVTVSRVTSATEHLRLVIKRTLMMRRAGQQRLDDDQCLLASIRTGVNTRQHDITVVALTCNQQ